MSNNGEDYSLSVRIALASGVDPEVVRSRIHRGVLDTRGLAPHDAATMRGAMFDELRATHTPGEVRRLVF